MFSGGEENGVDKYLDASDYFFFNPMLGGGDEGGGERERARERESLRGTRMGRGAMHKGGDGGGGQG